MLSRANGFLKVIWHSALRVNGRQRICLFRISQERYQRLMHRASAWNFAASAFTNLFHHHISSFSSRLKQCPGQAVHVQQRAQVRVGFQDAGSTGKLGARQLRILRWLKRRRSRTSAKRSRWANLLQELPINCLWVKMSIIKSFHKWISWDLL